MKKNAYILLFSILFFACEKVEKSIEGPIPEFFLTSTITETNETQVKVKGEITSVRLFVEDRFGIVYAEKPFPTIDNQKLVIDTKKGAFEIAVQNLKPKTAYYFRAFLQTKDDKVYYSNQLTSTSLYDNRWERLVDFPADIRFHTGILRVNNVEDYLLYNMENIGAGVLLNYGLKSNPNQKEWYSTPLDKSISIGLREMYVIEQNKTFLFFGGGFLINNNLPSSKVYNQNIWLNSAVTYPLPCPIEGETLGMTIDDKAIVISTKTKGEVYDFSNLEWKKLRDNGFVNLGRVISTTTSTKGYVLSESENIKVIGGTFYEYNPPADTWKQRKSFTGDERIEGIIFSCKGKIYYGLGRNKKTLQALKDIWEYDPIKDDWQQIAFYPGNGNVLLIQNVAKNNAVYLGMGYQTSINNLNANEFGGVKDFWRFKP